MSAARPLDWQMRTIRSLLARVGYLDQPPGAFAQDVADLGLPLDADAQTIRHWAETLTPTGADKLIGRLRALLPDKTDPAHDSQPLSDVWEQLRSQPAPLDELPQRISTVLARLGVPNAEIAAGAVWAAVTDHPAALAPDDARQMLDDLIGDMWTDPQANDLRWIDQLLDIRWRLEGRQ